MADFSGDQNWWIYGKLNNSNKNMNNIQQLKLSLIDALAFTGCQDYIMISNPASGKFLTQCSSKLTIDSMYNMNRFFM